MAKSWKRIVEYRRQAAEILTEQGKIKPLPADAICYNEHDHKLIVELAKKLESEEAAH